MKSFFFSSIILNFATNFHNRLLGANFDDPYPALQDKYPGSEWTQSREEPTDPGNHRFSSAVQYGLQYKNRSHRISDEQIFVIK
jgi:hypothetical protein